MINQTDDELRGVIDEIRAGDEIVAKASALPLAEEVLRLRAIIQEREAMEAAKTLFAAAWAKGQGPTLESLLRRFPEHGGELARFAVSVFERPP